MSSVVVIKNMKIDSNIVIYSSYIILAVMVKLELKSIEERSIWKMMQAELTYHNSYTVKQRYFPNDMDSWREMKSEIENKYRSEIETLQIYRKQTEKHDAMMEAAETLLIMKKREEYKEFYKAGRTKKTSTGTSTHRRSSRIANKCK